MLKWKMPPKAKLYEALSAVLDGRVRLLADGEAAVESSSNDKAYSVTWEADMSSITSNDNASFYQGYMGYPIIAVLMKIGKLEFDAALAEPLKGIHWKKINDQFKRDYDKAVDSALEQAGVDEAGKQALSTMVDQIYRDLEAMGLSRNFGQAKRPPTPR